MREDRRRARQRWNRLDEGKEGSKARQGGIKWTKGKREKVSHTEKGETGME